MIFYAGGDIGGATTHILSLAKELSKTEDVRLVSFRRGVFSRRAESMGIDVAIVDSDIGFSRTLREALRLYDEFRPDIIHCHGAKANLLGVLVKQRRGALIMSTVHSDPNQDYMGRPLKALTNGNLNLWALRRMDYHVAVADSIRDILIDMGLDPYNIFTVYNGFDFGGSSEGRREQKPDSETVTVGIAARLNPVKDIPTLMRAFAKAHAQDGRLRLSIAGTGEELEKLQALSNELGIDELVSFEGWLSDIKAYFKNIDINVLSSLSEGFPYSLLEGAYEHCPAVATNVGGIPSLIEHGITGYLVEPGDEDGLCKYILRLAGDAELRYRMGGRLYEKARAEYSIETMAEKQKAIYSTIEAREKRSGRCGAVLCGAYGRGNSGDEAILKAICLRLRSIEPDIPIWVMTRDPKGTSKSANVRGIYIFNVLRFIRALRRSTLFVNGGGSLIQDVTSARSLYFYLFTLIAAKKLGCGVIMYGCGIGPLKRPASRRSAAKTLNRCVDVITLRDGVSQKLLGEIGVDRPVIRLAADPVFSLPHVSDEFVKAAFEREEIPADLKMACFCIRSWEGFRGEAEVARAAEYVYSKYNYVPVFYPIEIPADIAINKRIASMLSCPHYMCRYVHPAGVQIGMLGSMELVCGMRLHSLIFATAGGSPVVGISYDVKVDGFISDIGSDLCLQMGDLKAEELCAAIDKAVEAGRESGLRAQQELLSRELRNGEALKDILGREEK